MGLHRSITANFNPVELESRKRLFWQIRKMDVYVGAMIGLPTMLSDSDIDQEMPLSIDDEFITPERIIQAPPGHIHLMTGSNAQTSLMTVLRKVIKYVYPIKNVQYMEGKPRSYVVGHAKIREIERDLQHWMEKLPMYLRPGGEASPELARYVHYANRGMLWSLSVKLCVIHLAHYSAGFSNYFGWRMLTCRCSCTGHSSTTSQSRATILTQISGRTLALQLA